MLTGTIAGICEYFGWSPDIITFVRILYVLLAFGSWGTLIPVYFVASWIIPSAGQGQRRQGDYQEHWERKSQNFDSRVDEWTDKMGQWSEDYSDKWANRYANKQTNKKGKRKIKEAEPIIDEKEDDWSDF